jgi:hypothetical protein
MPSAEKRERQSSILALLVGSVLPAVLGSSAILALISMEYSAWVFPVFFGQFIASLVVPYVLGWVRSLIAIIVAGVGMLWILSVHAIAMPWRALLAIGFVVAVGLLARASLRLGHVWKPADAKQPNEKSAFFPYPYF